MVGYGAVMTLAAGLLNTPRSQQDFDRWSFDLDQNVSDIRIALKAQRGISLPAYQLYPFVAVAPTEWLQRVGLALGEICSNLRIAAVDTENVDLEDDRSRQAWAWSVYSEIRDARAVLKI